MRIDSIELKNFGSYEGIIKFETATTDNNKNIIIIGGKNGAGKTTLFTAIRLCIYGCRSFGYQSINAFYNKKINKLINNNSKLNEFVQSYVKLDIKIENSQGYDFYTLCRAWEINKSGLNETTTIIKNGQKLNNSAMHDFENYILQIIPPELFDLYFFDGERIADFFLDDGGNVRLRNAFLTLCGYDTFEIMNKNFHRIMSSKGINNQIVDNYIKMKQDLTKCETDMAELKNKINQSRSNFDIIESEISSLDNDYKKKGGGTHDDWNKRISLIKKEEYIREEKNSWLKKMANEMIPFLMLKNQIRELIYQIETEEERKKVEYFLLQLQNENTRIIFSKALINENITVQEDILEKIFTTISEELKIENDAPEKILMLSNDEKSSVLFDAKKILDFQPTKILDEIKNIKTSIKRTQKYRAELEDCNIDYVNEYLDKRNLLYINKEQKIKEIAQLEETLKTYEENFFNIQNEFNKSKKNYEDELKKNSLNDISSRAIIMLHKLQDNLYSIQIENAKKLFRTEINTLMRKTEFIDDIDIDSKFNIRIYRNEGYSIDNINKLQKSYNSERLAELIGTKAVDRIKDIKKIESYNIDSSFLLPIEIDKNTLSNGEKQIFIMTLYRSLMQLCRYEVPYVIDSPFARIDAEHRNNIVQHFFKQLKGQVFIFSTNKEIDNTHIEMLSDKILASYTLKNDDNKKTTIFKNIYFEETLK